MSAPKKPKHIFKESSKIHQVTHWDMDYLPKDQIEALYGKAGTAPPLERNETNPRPKTQLALILIGVGVLLLLISVGLAALLKP